MPYIAIFGEKCLCIIKPAEVLATSSLAESQFYLANNTQQLYLVSMSHKFCADSHILTFQQADVNFRPKSRYFADQAGKHSESHENKLWAFSIRKINITNIYKSKKRWKKGLPI